MSAYILPVLIILLLIYAFIKKINAYKSFTKGALEGVKLVLDILPFIVAIMLGVELMRYSGVTDMLAKLLAPFFGFLGIPTELCEFVLLRPFTGAGSLALLDDIMTNFGPDSYITRVACTIMGTGETVFYVSAIYFSQISQKKIGIALAISLLVSFVSVILSCLICRFL